MVLYCLYPRTSNEEVVKLDNAEDIGTEIDHDPCPKRPKGKKETIKESQMDVLHAKRIILTDELHALEKTAIRKKWKL